MAYKNFELLIRLEYKGLNNSKSEKERKVHTNLYKLGIVMQELESELYDGYPYIYANMRVLIEEMMNFFIEYELEMVAEEGVGRGYRTSEQVQELIDDIKANRVKSWRGKRIKVERAAWNLRRKIDLVTACFGQKGVDIKSWKLHDWRKLLNDTNHNFFLPMDNVRKGVESRFRLLKEFHKIYREIVRLYYGLDTNEYIQPTQDELDVVVDKFNTRLHSYR